MNAVEHEPVETRVLNPTASEASYKPKQRSYRKTNLKKKKVLTPDSPGAELSGAKMSSAETYPTPFWNPSRETFIISYYVRVVSITFIGYFPTSFNYCFFS